MQCEHCGKRKASVRHPNPAPIQTPETTEVRSWTTLPLLDTTNIPKDLDLIGGSNEEYQSWRIPASLFLPGSSVDTLQHQFAQDNGPEVPEHSVLPVFVYNNNGNISLGVARANNIDNVAKALVVFHEGNQYTLMGSGFYKFSRPHLYTIGKTYYLSQDVAGEVVSCKPTAGIAQPLFTVIDANTIFINVALM